jgi:hypothetical protein
MNPPRKLNPIRHRCLLCALLACVAAGGREAVAQETNRTVRPDYASFRIVAERNIFNANRSGGPVRTIRETRNPGRVDAFRLVGIMEYDKGQFAFFDGTSPDYKKVLECQGTVAGYVLTNLTAESVTLAAEGKKLELRVGMQVRREDNGEWELASTGDLPAASGGGPGPGGSPALSESSGGDSGGDVSEVLKKLMQQREQE